MSLLSQYAALSTPDGKPMVVKSLLAPDQDLLLVIDLMNDGQVHAITRDQSANLHQAGRLSP